MSDAALYILMRSDMKSLNAGKAMAQAAHAANQFAATASTAVPTLYTEWEGQTPDGFGTTIVLDATSGECMYNVVEDAQDEGFLADIVLDPTYPISDGEVTHLIPVLTCGYVFTPCRVTQPVNALSNLALHP